MTVLASGPDFLFAIASDSMTLYWTTVGFVPTNSGALPASVMAICKDDTTTDTVLVRPTTPFAGFAVDAASIYWTDGASVLKIPKP